MSSRLPIFSEEKVLQRMTRESPFSYECNRCNRCCQNQRIRVNPYETARLARWHNISTTDFLANYTAENGTELRRDEKGFCVFLTEEGCGVHGDRPLVCRIYPLGRHLSWNFEEHFTHLSPHPETEGVYGQNETVETYIKSQGADPYIVAIDRYVHFLTELSAVLKAKQKIEENKEILNQWLDAAVPGGPGLRLIDMDLAVAEYCNKERLPFPVSVDEKSNFHLHYLEQLMQSLRVSGELTP